MAIMVWRRIPEEPFPRPTLRYIIVNSTMLLIITALFAFLCAGFSGGDEM